MSIGMLHTSVSIELHMAEGITGLGGRGVVLGATLEFRDLADLRGYVIDCNARGIIKEKARPLDHRRAAEVPRTGNHHRPGELALLAHQVGLSLIHISE